MNFNRLEKLNNLIIRQLKRKPTIILDPNPEQSYRLFGTARNIVLGIDADSWELPEYLKPFIREVAKSDISNEEKILKIYQKLCEDYTYDDNVLSYIKKNDDETFFLPDAYGREGNASWKEHREKHNRRNCFEVSRILAKSITEAMKISGCSRNYDICIVWDEANTHYFVGLACNDYYVSLDLDDFTQMKDLTRMKTGLTLEGIRVLQDPKNKFGTVVQKFNEGRKETPEELIWQKREQSEPKQDQFDMMSDEIDNDDVTFLQYTVQVLKEDYNLDSAGIYEYLKEVVDTKMGAQFRKKVWKEISDNPGIGTRYTRCLIVTINDVPYIIDVTGNNPSEIFRRYGEQDKSDNTQFIPYKKLERDWETDPYDGR